MPSYKLIVEYDGTPFHGWQAQGEKPSVQGALEEALYAYCGARARIYGAGRTDAGVHALRQVAHVALEAEKSPDEIRSAMNFHLRPLPVSVLIVEKVPDAFHARFDAVARHYLYRIINRAAPLALSRERAWFVPRALDIASMEDAATCLIGNHDFTSFRSANCQAASPVKTLDSIVIAREDEEIGLRFGAKSFLHHQVRAMTAALVEVGLGKWGKHDMMELLEARDHARVPGMAPACGLYLVRVDY